MAQDPNAHAFSKVFLQFNQYPNQRPKLWQFNQYIQLQTHNKRDAKHSAAPREHIHSRNPLAIPDTSAKRHE
jgi:hypothetical protein